ncbi:MULTISPECIES: replisome organizer [Clostridium]|uniref:replisome organizer n=1 Tax=Clostridium TaxID=1485 RepID=UPI0032EF8777
MAEKRMFSKTIIDSDAFLDMPLSSQALYFHLSMRADDDGFVNNPKKIQRLTGCGDDDLKLLMAKKFLIPFESGIVVIKHWRIHNYIRTDRYKETNYIEEKSMLGIEKNKAYSLLVENKDCTPLISLSQNGMSNGIPTGDKLDTQNRLDKNRLEENSIDKSRQEENGNCSSNFSNLDIFKHFEKCGFIVTAILMEQISADIEVYTAKWLMDAATEAMNRGKINNYKYVLGILQNWTSNGRNESNGNGATSKNNREESEEWIGL